MELDCPKCDKLMARDLTGAAPAWRCVECGGVWLDQAGMERRVKDAESLLAILSTTGIAAGLRCPSCSDRPLSQARYRRCEVDWCPTCRGVFFDPGELDEIKTELRDGRTSGLGGLTADVVGGVAGGAVIREILRVFDGS